MGSDITEAERYGNEDPHIVILSKGFWLAETTVAQALWQVVMGDNPSHFKQGESSNFPVESVSWEGAQGFIDKLNQRYTELGLRLPWEAQWEYACRAGTTTPFSFGDNITPEQVNYDGNRPFAAGENGLYREKTVIVKSCAANAWGLHEMHGNVWEWCEDAWQEHLGTEQVTDPWLNDGKRQEGAGRVLRGGSWSDRGGIVRSAMRSRITPVNPFSSIGLRLSLGL